MIKKLLAVLLVTFMLPVGSLFAKDLTAAWDYNVADEPDASEYRLYESLDDGVTYQLKAVIDDMSLRSYDFTGPDADGCYRYTMTAYDALYNEESTRSNEAAYCMQGGVMSNPIPVAPGMLEILER